MKDLILIRTGRNPFQTALLAVSVASGVSGLLVPPPGPSMNIYQAFGPVGTPILYGCLLLSASAALLGMYWCCADVRSAELGLRIERAGLPLLAGVSLAYASTNLIASGSRALVASLLIGGIATAALARARQITKDIRDLTRSQPSVGDEGKE